MNRLDASRTVTLCRSLAVAALVFLTLTACLPAFAPAVEWSPGMRAAPVLAVAGLACLGFVWLWPVHFFPLPLHLGADSTLSAECLGGRASVDIGNLADVMAYTLPGVGGSLVMLRIRDKAGQAIWSHGSTRIRLFRGR